MTPELSAVCGQLIETRLQPGLTNRVFRIKAGAGDFFLRLPHSKTAGMIDRQTEYKNLVLAAELELAVPPVYCDPVNGILLTKAIETSDALPETLAERLGDAIGRLHSSAVEFAGVLSPETVYRAQKSAISHRPELLKEVVELDSLLGVFLARNEEPHHTESLVPSHGDLSPGNCLATPDRIWLIDWEYSGMSVPAWDLAYAILENDFSSADELVFLESYTRAGSKRFLPSPRYLDFMKSQCDAVSALWALEQIARGRGATRFLPFARDRVQRALRRLRSN